MNEAFQDLYQTFIPEGSLGDSLVQQKATLMILDDSQDVIHSLEIVLGKHYQLEKCLTFEEAKTRLNDSVQAVLLDIKMAVVDGIEVFQRLKQMRPDLPIIFHSAYPGSDEHVSVVEKLPHSGYLVKGEYSVAQLLETIQQAIPQS